MPESKEFLRLLDNIRDLHKRKNDGYAGKDAMDPWANFRMAERMGVSAFKGCLIRMSDKFVRIMNLTRDAENDQVGESVVDTLMDLSVYSLIAICLYNEQSQYAEVEKFLKAVSEIQEDELASKVKDILEAPISLDTETEKW